jgi:hypothetical protein
MRSTPRSAIAARSVVKWSLHRDTRVLEAGDVDDPGHAVLVDGFDERGAVEDGCSKEGHFWRHESCVPARQVIDDHRFQPCCAEGSHDVCTDIAGAAGHHPGHGLQITGGISWVAGDSHHGS